MFFKRFPKKLYNFDFAANSTVLVTDVLSRVRFNSKILNNVSVFYKYQLQDGDTPEIVAYKEYGDAEYHWIIIMLNDIKDPQFDFPLNIDALERMIIKKYGYTGNSHGEKIAQAYNNIHHYELETTKTLVEVGGATTINVTSSIVTLNQYSYKTNSLVSFSGDPTIQYVYPQNTSNTVYFKANNSGQNTASSANATSSLKIVEKYKPIYVYEYELEQNEKKREIKLLKQEYISSVSNELEVMLRR